VVEDGAYLRKHFWGADPRLEAMVRHLSDDNLKKRGSGSSAPRDPAPGRSPGPRP
jgi:pyruvate dehydrogenase E1 component